MKKQISITLDEQCILYIDSEVKKGRFRNRSHGLEYAARQLNKEKPEIESQA